jgi:hypothetical protein
MLELHEPAGAYEALKHYLDDERFWGRSLLLSAVGGLVAA